MQQGTHTTVIVPPAAAPAQGGCSCSVPANASSHVKGARAAAIAIIVIQTIAFLAVGWALWPIWLASLLAWIMGGIQLCMFTKCSYIAAGICYIFGLIFDLVGVAFWASVEASDDYDTDGNAGWLALPPALAAIAMLIGIVFSFMAVCNWDKSGAPDAVPASGGPQAVPAATTVQMTQVKGQPPPPAYSGTV